MDTSDTRARLARSRRMRVAVRVGVTALVLALVIVVFGALSAPKTTEQTATTEPTATVTPAGAQDYAAGLSALASGDTTQAIALLTKAAAAGNTAAKARLGEVSKPSSAATSTPATTAPDAYAKAVADLATLLPTEVAGYTAQNVETSTLSAILPLQPTKAGPASTVSLAVLTVLDKKTVAGARKYVAGFGKAYPKNRSTVRVGTVSAQFGTDGSHLAAVVFSRGRYAFEAVVTVSKGSPASLKGVSTQAAAAFPASR